MKLDDTMLMYRIYNAETLEKLINTVQEIHNATSSHEELFVGEHNPTLFRLLYMDALGIQQYAIQLTAISKGYPGQVHFIIQGTNHSIMIIYLSYQSACERLLTYHSANTKQIATNFGRGQEVTTTY